MGGIMTVGDDLINFAVEMADVARKHITDRNRKNIAISLKPDRSYVTEMDVSIEKLLRSMIRTKYPEHGIIGEELDWVEPDADYVWVLDPIDGTASYIAGMPVYGTLIALAFKGVPVLGIIDIPPVDARWIGVSGRQTTKNGVACSVGKCDSLASAIMSTSNPDFYEPAELPALDCLRSRTSWRIYGGASLAYGLLAQGGTDIALDTGLKIYDFAPFRPIIEGADGVISDWDGQAITLKTGKRILAAGNVDQHREILQLIKELNIPK